MALQRKQKKYAVEEVLVHVRGNTNVRNKKLLYEDFDGDQVKVRSDRLLLFKRKGVVCVACGLEGKYFVKEKNPADKHWHFNLYGVTPEGEEVLMTKDHIKPKSKGGKDALYNYQTMCITCNGDKGDTMPKKVPRKKMTKPELEKEVARLKSILGGKDGTVSKLTKDNRDKDQELTRKRREFAHLKAENKILQARIRQLIELMAKPIIVDDTSSGG